MSMTSVPPGAGAGGALLLVLGLAALVAAALRTGRPLARVSLYLLLGAALLLLAGAPPDALDPEDRRQTVLVVALVAGGMLASDVGGSLRRGATRHP